MRQIDLHRRFFIQAIEPRRYNADDRAPRLRILPLPGKLIRLPSGSWFGHNCAAIVWLISATLGESAVSPSVISRPSIVDVHRLQVTRRGDIKIDSNFFTARLGLVFNYQAAPVEVVAER